MPIGSHVLIMWIESGVQHRDNQGQDGPPHGEASLRTPLVMALRLRWLAVVAVVAMSWNAQTRPTGPTPLATPAQTTAQTTGVLPAASTVLGGSQAGD